MAALDPLFVPGGLSPRDARIALGGLLASQGAGLDIRTGVLSGYTVTGTSATGPMRVSVAAGHHVAMRSTSDGPEVGANDGATLVDIPTAPASNARIDLVWVRATDTERDGSTAAEIGVTATGAVSATPTGPYGDVPAGALVLAEVRVAAGAVRTTDPQVTITNVAEKTVARGAAVPVTSAAKRDALTVFDGLQVKRLDQNGLVETYMGVTHGWQGGAWRPFTPVLTAFTTNPSLGPSTLVGYYSLQGKTCHYMVMLTIANGFDRGVGPWYVSVPVPASSRGNGLAIGSGIAYNQGARRPLTPVLESSVNRTYFVRNSNETTVTDAGPGALWAVDDVLAFRGTYEIA